MKICQIKFKPQTQENHIYKKNIFSHLKEDKVCLVASSIQHSKKYNLMYWSKC